MNKMIIGVFGLIGTVCFGSEEDFPRMSLTEHLDAITHQLSQLGTRLDRFENRFIAYADIERIGDELAPPREFWDRSESTEYKVDAIAQQLSQLGTRLDRFENRFMAYADAGRAGDELAPPCDFWDRFEATERKVDVIAEQLNQLGTQLYRFEARFLAYADVEPREVLNRFERAKHKSTVTAQNVAKLTTQLCDTLQLCYTFDTIFSQYEEV
ncbi:MAG: hypothetical protein LBQ43_04525 [Holosporales bacterium]|jgi:coenzyme F420-reducing hydrogenase delta subunit|nr:hypothetical protein [Holosporales bacterium]